MKKTVILAEKPSQAGAYAEAFNKHKKENGYYVVSNEDYENAIITYGFGHLVSLYSPDEYDEKYKSWRLETLPIIPDPFKFKVEKDKKKQYQIVKKHLDSADEIVIATDSDREGEAIARLIINLSGNANKEIKRLWINSLEIEEIKKGFKNLRNGEEFYSTYKEAESRQFADWLVGMNLSRLYTIYMQKEGMNGAFSIGRVQTPTLYLIHQRNKVIENFKSKPFYELFSKFSNDKGEYEGKYNNRFNSLEELNTFKKKNNLDHGEGKVKEVNIKEKNIYAPKLYSLSDLQSDINKKYNYGASETLKIVQSLYEKKLVSYPRTDTNFIGDPEFNYLKENLNKYLKLLNETIEDPELEKNKRYVNGAKVQEHYAIIPTRNIGNLDSLSSQEKNIYEAILYRTISIFEKPYTYDETTIVTEVNSIEFNTTGKIEKNIGWKKFFKNDEKEDDKILPMVLENETLNSNLFFKEGKTTPPKYFTEGTLITAMKNAGKEIEDEENQEILKETEGIGTEATRAGIIDTLKYQKYILISKNKVLVTEKGKTLCETLKDTEITNVELTAKWEKYLKKIKEGSGSQKAFIESIIRFINHLIDTAPKVFKESDIETHVEKIKEENTLGVCPKCKENIIDKGKFYGCTGYQVNNCKFTIPKKWSGKNLTKKNVSDLISKQETALIKGFTSKKGSKFNAKLRINDNNFLEFIFDNK